MGQTLFSQDANMQFIDNLNLDHRSLELSGAVFPLETVPLFGLPVANLSMENAVAWLAGRIEHDVRTRVAFINAHCVNVAVRSSSYRSALNEADIVLPDGSGIALAARLRGVSLRANLNGTDLVPLLCQELADQGRSVFLLGGREGVADAAAAALRLAIPELRIAGSRDGYFEADEEDAVIAEINASDASLVLVAMGVPLQETWLHRVAPKLNATMTMGVGGLFDFLSGRIPRAGQTLRGMGLEWTYRLYQEPSRMWRRYIVGNPAFVGRAVIDAAPAMLNGLDLMLKRLIDVIGAGVGLLLAAPLFLIVAIAIRATTPGSALLKQTRVGQNGKTFALYKFRSMYIDAEARRAELEKLNQHGADGVTFKLRRDPRVTPIGRLLRKSSIDELPQLWNILIGDMSLVGPRPPLPAEVAKYRPEERRRLAAKPGLTCLWQVSGRADLPFARQVALDIEYLTRRNVFLDILILLRTIPAVLLARGAY